MTEAVLLIDVGDALAVRLAGKISGFGKLPLRARALDLVNGRYEVLFERGSLAGVLHASDWERPHPIQFFGSSYAEAAPLPLGGGCRFEELFLESEAVAWLAFLRAAIGRAVNPPTMGAVTTSCGSLPEQWAAVGTATGAMRPPAWRLEAEVQCVEVFDRTSIVALENVFDPAIPEPDAIGDLRGPAIVAERPRGALCACAFVGDRVAHRRLGLDGPQPFDPPETARAAIGGTIAALRSAFELEVGEIGYSYLDELVFWSVTPAFALEGFGALESDELVTALAEMLCR